MAVPNFDMLSDWLGEMGDIDGLLEQVDKETETFVAQTLSDEIFAEEPQAKYEKLKLSR